MAGLLDIVEWIKIEFTLPSGVVSVNPDFDENSKLSFRRGVSVDREVYVGSMSFDLHNVNEKYTIGNTASPYFNQLVKGVPVQFSIRLLTASEPISGLRTQIKFTGNIVDIIPVYYATPDENRASFKVEGLSALMIQTKNYDFPVTQNIEVHHALTAIASAAGIGWTVDTTTLKVPFAYPRENPLQDMAAFAKSDPSSLLFEGGAGGRFKSSVNMFGGYATPAHTWGTTLQPVGTVTPLYKNDSQFARQTIKTTLPVVDTEPNIVLYRHPLNVDAGIGLEYFPPGAEKRITGTFSRIPVSVNKKFTQSTIYYTDSGDDLDQNLDAVGSAVTTRSNVHTTFSIGDRILIDQEVMIVTAAVTWPAGQALLVDRGQDGTIAAPHTTSLMTPKAIFWRPKVLLKAFIGNLPSPIQGSSPSPVDIQVITPSPFYPPLSDFIEVGSKIQIASSPGVYNQEIFTVNTILSPQTVRLNRAQDGTSFQNHNAGGTVHELVYQYPTDSYGPSHLKTSFFPSGRPLSDDAIVGVGVFAGADHIQVQGRKFSAIVRNSDLAIGRYMSDFVIGGEALRETNKEVVDSYEAAIPYMGGLPEGKTLELPYGVTDMNVAKGAAVGALFAGRVPTPWIDPTFKVDSTAMAASIVKADIGDMVLFDGLGTNREKVKEYFRILGVQGNIATNRPIEMQFTLAPAHIFRDPSKCYYTEFNTKPNPSGNGLGPFLVHRIGGPNAFLNDTNWSIFYGTSAYNAPNRARNVFGTSDWAGVDVGSAEQIVNIRAEGLTSGTFAATTGGWGAYFRGNVGFTQRWEMRFNATQSRIYLWNTTDGLVGTPYVWTPTSIGELEVRAFANWIRVYLDARPEPIIEAVSTRFQTNQYAGLAFVRSSGGSSPFYTRFYAQAA